MGGVLTDLVRWVIDVVHSLGYVGVFVLILAGSLSLPVPTELTLPLFGFLMGNGRLTFVPVLFSARKSAYRGEEAASCRWYGSSACTVGNAFAPASPSASASPPRSGVGPVHPAPAPRFSRTARSTTTRCC